MGFSNRKDEPIVIVADDRERASCVIDILRGIENISVHVDRLPVGDYLAEKRLLIEPYGGEAGFPI